MAAKTTSVDEYLDALDPAYRAELDRIRALVVQFVPDAEELMSYGMPTLKYKKRALVYFTASRKHLSFYPSSFAIEELKGRLGQYSTTEHAIRFSPDTPLPDDLIRDLVRVHQREIDADG